jgi:hypothetical protein
MEEIDQLKFRFVFIILNIVILLFLAFILLVPFAILGPDIAKTFLNSGWPLIVVLIVVLAALNIFYIANRKLFFLLEREDWPALVYYLESEVIQKSRYSPRLVTLLANTYLVLSDAVSVTALEKKLSAAKPSLLESNCLTFGVARILSKDYKGAAQFFEKRLNSSKTESAEWVRWYYGFSKLLDENYTPAADEFMLLVKECRDPLIIGLSAYFLEHTLAKTLSARKEELKQCAEDGRRRVRTYFPSQAAWKKDAAKMKTEIYATIIIKYINNAENWIYAI